MEDPLTPQGAQSEQLRRRGWDPERAMQALAQERQLLLDGPDTSERTQAQRLLREALPVAVSGVVQLAMYGETDKMRFDAQKYIIDRNLGATSREGDLSSQELDPIERLQAEIVTWVKSGKGLG